MESADLASFLLLISSEVSALIPLLLTSSEANYSFRETGDTYANL